MIFHSQLDEDELIGNGPSEPNAVEFQQLINEYDSKRIFLCGETIFHFKQNPQRFKGNNRSILTESYFYCKLCLQSLDKRNVIRHCASYIHLFRHLSSSFPLEYERVIDPKILYKSTDFVTKFYENLIKREKGFSQVPKLVLLDHLKINYDEFKNNYPQKNSAVFLTNINLRTLNDLNERDEERILDEQRSNILKSTNQPVTNSFFQHIIDSNEDDFIAAPITDPNPGRFTDHQSNLRPRDRGSMRTAREEAFIKKEPLEELRMEDHRIEQIRPEPEPEPEYQPEPEPEQEPDQDHDIEENSVEFLKELAEKALAVIETNDLNVDKEFIEEIKKYGDLLVYYDLIDVNQSNLLNRMFNQIEENKQGEIVEPNTQQFTIVDTSSIKTEKIYDY